ncbi:MAG TPA: hypothetical protein VFO59_02685 [Dehalococcoidia bacterium]|nr:hypothetical protein [Dehalococcoidia bacterium]
MHEDNDQRDRLRERISENQRRATQLSILLKLEAQENADLRCLEETADLLESAVGELEQARRVLVSA